MPKIELQSFSGTHHEIGVKQGQAIRGPLRELLRQLAHLVAVKLLKPQLLPAYLAIAKFVDLMSGEIVRGFPVERCAVRPERFAY